MRQATKVFLVAMAFSLFSCQYVAAQLNQDNQEATGNVSGQTGQSSNFLIQRDNTGFIGGAASTILGGQGAATGNTALRGLGGANLLGGFGRGNSGLGGQLNQQQTAEPQIRFRITLGFTYPRASGAQVSAKFAQRLTRIPQLKSAQQVFVSMEDRTAVLAGQVESEHEKVLIEKLALMEPGVSEVRNEMTVRAAPELLPPAEATN